VRLYDLHKRSRLWIMSISLNIIFKIYLSEAKPVLRFAMCNKLWLLGGRRTAVHLYDLNEQSRLWIMSISLNIILKSIYVKQNKTGFKNLSCLITLHKANLINCGYWTGDALLCVSTIWIM
jgi:hypothetical protein